MNKFLYLILAAMVLAGCAMLEENPASVGLAVQVATMKVIEENEPEHRDERAERILAMAGEARTFLDLEEVTIPALRAAIDARLAELELEPSDRALADLLVDAIAYELEERLGEGILSPEDRETVSRVLSSVETAARIYL